MDRKHLRWTRLPQGFTQEELHEATVEFRTLSHEGTGTLKVFPKPDGYFEIQVEVVTNDHFGSRRLLTIHHQTSHELFRIERLSNPGEAAFRLLSYTPSPSDLDSGYAVSPPRSDQTTRV